VQLPGLPVRLRSPDRPDPKDLAAVRAAQMAALEVLSTAPVLQSQPAAQADLEAGS
jgi:hypothetical protein